MISNTNLFYCNHKELDVKLSKKVTIGYHLINEKKKKFDVTVYKQYFSIVDS